MAIGIITVSHFKIFYPALIKKIGKFVRPEFNNLKILREYIAVLRLSHHAEALFHLILPAIGFGIDVLNQELIEIGPGHLNFSALPVFVKIRFQILYPLFGKRMKRINLSLLKVAREFNQLPPAKIRFCLKNHPAICRL